MTRHDKLFTLYAANIAAGVRKDIADIEAKEQLNYFNHYNPTPPAQELFDMPIIQPTTQDYQQKVHYQKPEQEETGLWVARDKDGLYYLFGGIPERKILNWACREADCMVISEQTAVALVGPMTWEDEPRMINISKP